MNWWYLLLYSILPILAFLAYRWQKNNSSEEKTKPSKKEDKHEEKKEEKEEKKKHDEHDDHHDHAKAKPEKVLTTGEKIFMWILLIPFLLIIFFVGIPHIFPTLWGDLGGPVLWDKPLFWPMTVLLVLVILLSLIQGDGTYYIMFVFLSLLLLWSANSIKKENEVKLQKATEAEILIYENIPDIGIKLKYQGLTPATFKVRYPTTIIANECGKNILLTGKSWRTPVVLKGYCEGNWEQNPDLNFILGDKITVTALK